MDKYDNELAQEGLKAYIEICLGITDETIIKEIERLGYQLGIDAAFMYANHFYMNNDNKATRQWLRKAQYDAKTIDKDIGARVKMLKKSYNDWIPQFLPF